MKRFLLAVDAQILREVERCARGIQAAVGLDCFDLQRLVVIIPTPFCIIIWIHSWRALWPESRFLAVLVSVAIAISLVVYFVLAFRPATWAERVLRSGRYRNPGALIFEAAVCRLLMVFWVGVALFRFPDGAPPVGCCAIYLYLSSSTPLPPGASKARRWWREFRASLWRPARQAA